MKERAQKAGEELIGIVFEANRRLGPDRVLARIKRFEKTEARKQGEYALAELVRQAVREYGRTPVLEWINRMKKALAWERLPAREKRRIEAAYRTKVKKRVARVIESVGGRSDGSRSSGIRLESPRR